MNQIKTIKNEQDYKDSLALMGELIAIDPDPESDQGEQLSLLATLIEDYESKIFPETLPSAIDAIKFCMDQKDLKAADLVPYIGSPSRVSEILSGKRFLTVDMMRALEEGLGIPAKVLLKKDSTDDSVYEGWSPRLIKEMSKRGYFNTKSDKISDLIRSFFSNLASPEELPVLLRKSHYRSSPTTDRRALAAWSEYVLKKAKAVNAPIYVPNTVNLSFMQNLAKLSVYDDGPLRVQDALKKAGIILIIEREFEKTYLDGAAIMVFKDNPVIGLTLRYDRVDNFWFTLMHELAHISLHFNDGVSQFYDEIEGLKNMEVDQKEKEADDLAREALISKNKWEISPAKIVPSLMAAKSLAKEIGVHVAVVAGRMRYEGGKYMYLNSTVNDSKVRHHFYKN